MALNHTPVLAGRKMSDSLRERLKRTSRYYSPQNPKRQCAEASQEKSDNGQGKIISVSSKPIIEDIADNNCEKENDESSQDFEYSDNENDKSALQMEENPGPIKNISLQLEEMSPEKCMHTATKRTVCMDKLVIPKFERTKFSKTHSSVKPVEDIHEEGSDAKAMEVTEEYQDKKPKIKNQIPSFTRTPVRNLKKAAETTTNISNSTLKSGQLGTSAIDKSESKEEKTINIDHYEEEKTEIITNEEIDGMSGTELNALKHNVHLQLEQKKEILRKLKMVKMYRSKNNLSELEHLISKWRSVCHEALEELLNLLQTSERKEMTSVYQLAKYFQLDVKLLQIQPEEDSQDQ